jgi:hypothetical protein
MLLMWGMAHQQLAMFQEPLFCALCFAAVSMRKLRRIIVAFGSEG